MIRFRMGYDKDKAAKWLNRMAEQGWAMTGYTLGFYRFEKCEPGEYIYQVDIAENLFGVSEGYQQFMEEMGVEIVSIWGPWVTLRRRTEEGPFEMYTDVESTIAHYTKVRKLFQGFGVLECACMLCGIYGAVLQKEVMGWVTACAAAVILLLFLREIVRLNGILRELNSRLGKTPEPGGGLAGMRTGGAVIGLLGVVLLWSALYAVLHVLGRCIAVWICGGTVSFSPYLTYKGLSGHQSLALVDIAGTVLPLAAAAAILLLYKGSQRHLRLNICLGILSGVSIVTAILPWIVESVCCQVSPIYRNSDVFHFIHHTEAHPAVVTFCAIIVFLLMCLLFAKRVPGFIGRVVGRNFMISVGALAIACAAVIQMVSLLFAADRIAAEGTFRYAMEGNKDSILQEEFAIEIRQPGEYVAYADWEVDRDGVIPAVVFQNEDEIFFSCTGVFVDAEFQPKYLESGKYTLSFYLLSSEEDWLEYGRITGTDVSDIEDFPYQADALATVTGSYRFVYRRFS